MPVDPRIQAALDAPLTTATDLRFRPVKGYVQPPGTGPLGEFCQGCRHAHPTGSDYRTWFCNLVRDLPRTTIRLDTKACGRWEARR